VLLAYAVTGPFLWSSLPLDSKRLIAALTVLGVYRKTSLFAQYFADYASAYNYQKLNITIT